MKGLWEMAKEKNGRHNGAAPAAEEHRGASKAITIELPIGGSERPGYQAELIAGGEVSLDAGTTAAMHVNLQIGPRAAAAFVRVRNGLRAAGAKRPDGRPVWTNADAMRYVFEAIADADESENGAAQ